MDQEFDGKGITPYDPAHNSTYLLAGKSIRALHSKKKRKYDDTSLSNILLIFLHCKKYFPKLEGNK